MATRDKGVLPGLLDRHFGTAGTGKDLNEKAERARRAEARRLRRQHAKAFDAVVAGRPDLPPGRKAKP